MKKMLSKLSKVLLIVLGVYSSFIILGYLFLDFDAGGSIRMGSGYFIFEQPSNLVTTTNPDIAVDKSIYKKKRMGVFTQVIPPNIKKYANDRKYIVAFQETMIPKNTIQGTIPCIDKEFVYQYWVINKKNDSIFGPLDLDQYKELKERKEIKIELER